MGEPVTPLVVIPAEAAVEYVVVLAPVEAPGGAVEAEVMEVRYAGRRFQFLGDADEELAMDLGDGAVVRLRHGGCDR